MTTRCCSRKPSEYFLIQRLLYFYFRIKPVGFPGGMVKSLPAHAGGIRNANSIPGSGTYPGERHGSPPWTEKPGRLQSIGLRRVEHD